VQHIAQINIASLYKNGKGTEKGLEKAIYWYGKAAESGDELARYNLLKLLDIVTNYCS